MNLKGKQKPINRKKFERIDIFFFHNSSHSLLVTHVYVGRFLESKRILTQGI